MTILFYGRAVATIASSTANLPPGVTSRIWCPSEHGLSGCGSTRLQNFIWWSFDKIGVFASPAFAEVSLWRNDAMLHRLIVTPRWYRFPFMGLKDLQIGDVWTRPDCRGQAYANLAITLAQRYAIERGARHLWYLVEADNKASIRLIQSHGYRLLATGARTRPLGIAAIGRFCPVCRTP